MGGSEPELSGRWEGEKKLKVDGNAKMQNLVERLSFDGCKKFLGNTLSNVCKRNVALFKIYKPFGT